MDKYAAEKIAAEYYNLGYELALESVGLGMNKTAGRGKDIAKMLGIGGAGVAGGAALASHLAPEAERAAVQLSDMAPMQFLREIGAAGKSRLAKADFRAQEMLKNIDLENLGNVKHDHSLTEGLVNRLAASSQSLKPSVLAEMPMINHQGNPVSKMEALNYLNPMSSDNIYNLDTLRGMGIDVDTLMGRAQQ
jgi:hypothetical protein